MEYVDFGIIGLAALMVWLLYKATQETRAYAAKRGKYSLRQARTRDLVREHMGETPTTR
jgi:hypothetical protein